MKEHFIEQVTNYTKYKLIEMLIEKHKDCKLDNLNAMEQLSDNILDVLNLCGLKFYGEMSNDIPKKPD